MTAAPRLIFEVDLESTDVWTDLSDRVQGFTMDRGRQTEFDTFKVGVATLVLDNTDRQLDPSATGSLTELAAGKGYPRCPARVLVDWDGSEWPLLVGVLGEEPWIPTDAPHSPLGAVTVDVVDMMGREALVQLVDDLRWAAIRSLDPEWWGRTLGDSADGSDFPDWSANADPGTLDHGTTPAISTVNALGEQSTIAGLRLDEARVVLPAAMAAATNDLTVFCLQRSVAGSGASEATIAYQDWTATLPGWRIWIDYGTARIYARIYAATGTVLQTLDVGAAVGPDSTNVVLFTIEGGVVATLWGAASSDTWTSGTVPTGFSGDVVFRTTTAARDADISEMCYWQTPITVADTGMLALVLLAYGFPWISSTDPADRLAAWQTLSETPGATVQLHPTTLPLLTAATGVPSTLADAYADVAESGRGATYALRDGTIRVRTIQALTDGSLAAHYATAIANLTDEPSPAASPVPIRRTAPTWSGVRLAEVFNVSTVSWWYGWERVSVSAMDPASIASFGRRERAYDSDFANEAYSDMLAIAEADVARYSQPRRRMDSITIEPALDGVDDPEDAIRFVVEDLELEKAVEVTWTPQGGSPVTETLNVQGEKWSWTPERWTVTLALAES